MKQDRLPRLCGTPSIICWAAFARHTQISKDEDKRCVDRFDPIGLYCRMPFQLPVPMVAVDHLEQHARKVITASELQAWATNLLAEYPTYSASQDYQMRTNYPVKLRPLRSSIGPLVS